MKCLRECYWKEENGEYLGYVVVLAGLHFRSTRAQVTAMKTHRKEGKLCFYLNPILASLGKCTVYKPGVSVPDVDPVKDSHGF